MIRIRVNGVPAPQGSKRHVGGGRMVESSRAVGPWREAVRAEAQRYLVGRNEAARCGLCDRLDAHAHHRHEPLSLVAVFLLDRPKGHYGTGRNAGTLRPSAPAFPATIPDLSKLIRAIEDALTDAGVWGDDSQVCSISAAKVYARPGEAPGVIIEVDGMKEET